MRMPPSTRAELSVSLIRFFFLVIMIFSIDTHDAEADVQRHAFYLFTMSDARLSDIASSLIADCRHFISSFPPPAIFFFFFFFFAAFSAFFHYNMVSFTRDTPHALLRLLMIFSPAADAALPERRHRRRYFASFAPLR